LPQRLDHRILQAATGLRVNRSIDRLMADMGSRVIGFHAPQSVRDLLGRPAQMYKLAVNEAVEVVPLDQLALAPTACAALIIDAPRRLRAVTTIVLTTTRKLPADRARGPAREVDQYLADYCPVDARRKSRHVPHC
jgi:hypothetical protein